MLKIFLKRIMVFFADNKTLSNIFSPIRDDYVPVFMLHRMEDKRYGVRGHSSDFLRQALTYLRDNHYAFLSLEDLIVALDGKFHIPSKSVVFTMDDGFYDQIELAVPIFREFSCPVTIFILPDFVDSKSWPWDYQVEYAINATKKINLMMNNDIASIELSLENEDLRQSAINEIQNMLKHYSTEDAERFTHEMSSILGVEISAQPPRSYRSISWDDARRLEGSVVKFGPHTANHSILFSQTDEVSRYQINYSRQRLQDELKNPASVFCYPTGRLDVDFGRRDMQIVKSCGFGAAVSTVAGYVDIKKDGAMDNRYQLKRFSLPDTMTDFIQLCSWVECVKDLMRRQSRKYLPSILFPR